MSKADREYWGERVEDAIDMLYGEDAEGIDREVLKEEALER